MLGLGLDNWVATAAGIGRNQTALRHLQLALLRLNVRTVRLQPAQGAIERTALRRQLTQRCRQRAGIRRKSSSRGAT